MDPATLLFAIIAARVIQKAMFEAAADQVRVEFARARSAIAENVRGRLRDRLEDARRAGPARPLWWVWAGIRAVRALRRAMRREPRPAEDRPRAIRATTGPLQRIWGAAWRALRFTWIEIRRQWREEPQQRPRRPQGIPVGVCERCGAVAAATALAWAWRPDGHGQWRICPYCRGKTAGEPPGERPEPEPRQEAPADAETVADGWEPVPPAPAPEPVAAGPASGRRPALAAAGADPRAAGSRDGGGDAWAAPAPGLAAQIRALADLFPEPERIRTRPPAGAGTPEQQAALDRAERACAAAGTTLDALDPAERQELLGAAAAAAHDPARWEAMCREHEAARRATQTSTASDPAPPEAARQQPAQTTPALPRGTGEQMLDGEIHTQADWGDQSGELGELLGALTRADENVLRCLRARECGRTQVELSKQWADHTAAVMTRWRGRVTGVNARQDPVVGAIQSAGGPEETARKGYYDEM